MAVAFIYQVSASLAHFTYEFELELAEKRQKFRLLYLDVVLQQNPPI